MISGSCSWLAKTNTYRHLSNCQLLPMDRKVPLRRTEIESTRKPLIFEYSNLFDFHLLAVERNKGVVYQLYHYEQWNSC